MKYSGSLTREQFMFREMRIVARMKLDGLDENQIMRQVYEQNLFQYPTEREIKSKCRAVLKRLGCLSRCPFLQETLAYGGISEAKQSALVAMMLQNRLVAEFMIGVIGEKLRLLDMTLTEKDINLFFNTLRDADEGVAGWSETTISRIKGVLRQILRETGYMEGSKNERLYPVFISDDFEVALKDAGLTAYLPAFNVF